MKDVEACRDIAEIWFVKGQEEFSKSIISYFKISDWDKYFDKLWEEFTTFKLKCKKCGQITVFNIDFSYHDIDFYANFDINKYLKGYISLFCSTCCKFNDLIKVSTNINKNWEIVK